VIRVLPEDGAVSQKHVWDIQ